MQTHAAPSIYRHPDGFWPSTLALGATLLAYPTGLGLLLVPGMGWALACNALGVFLLVLSLVWSAYDHPALARTDLIPDEPPADFPPYDLYPTPKDWVPPGVLSSAKGTSAEKGRRMVLELAQRMAAAVAEAIALIPFSPVTAPKTRGMCVTRTAGAVSHCITPL